MAHILLNTMAIQLNKTLLMISSPVSNRPSILSMNRRLFLYFDLVCAKKEICMVKRQRLSYFKGICGCLLLLPLLTLISCSDNDDKHSSSLPQLSAAESSQLLTCTDLASQFSFANTEITSVETVTAGTLTVGDHNIAEHCLVTGKMNERASSVDPSVEDASYAIGFEMRLPVDWNGRFFYQGNGGLDGVVKPAVGAVSGGGFLTNALDMGFAVISSDAGHSGYNPLFGLDPQARLDYGYNAVASLTPMAKALITAAYGRGPDRSYIGGTSNGGRHTMVAATREPEEYDGYLAGAPGFHLPKAAIAQLFGAQQYANVLKDEGITPELSGSVSNLNLAFTEEERQLVANAILEKCDDLDGATDGMVEDVEGCHNSFDLLTDVPTCSSARDGSCLSEAQKSAITAIYSGARNSKGEALYNDWPFDPGLISSGWAAWEFNNSVSNRDPVSAAFTFMTPPEDPSVKDDTLGYALNFNMDTDAPKIFATSGIYTESAWSFMVPVNETDLSVLRDRGAKMIVYHGTCDPVFSVNDTTDWYDAVTEANDGDATDFVRFFRVPGMSHSRKGISTDQFNALSALIDWVEKGVKPDRIIATARGDVNNPGGQNPEIPSNWDPNRTRPLCPYPKIAVFTGTDANSDQIEDAANFTCQ